MNEGSLSLAAYGLSLLADPCLVVSAAVAGTLGGRAYAWGLAFGTVHFLFGIFGLSISSRFLSDSEISSHVIALLLIALFFAHTARHADSHDCCSCEDTPKRKWSRGGLLLGSLLGVAFHATGVGVVLQVAGSDLSRNTLYAALAFGGIYLGFFVALVVNQHDALAREARRAVRWMPGLVTAVLVALFAHLSLSIIEELDPTIFFNSQYVYFGVACVAIVLGIVVQTRSMSHHHGT